jgi:hypothetical protein
VVRAYNPSTREVEAEEWQIPGQPGLYSEILSMATTKKTCVCVEGGRAGGVAQAVQHLLCNQEALISNPIPTKKKKKKREKGWMCGSSDQVPSDI